MQRGLTFLAGRLQIDSALSARATLISLPLSHCLLFFLPCAPLPNLLFCFLLPALSAAELPVPSPNCHVSHTGAAGAQDWPLWSSLIFCITSWRILSGYSWNTKWFKPAWKCRTTVIGRVLHMEHLGALPISATSKLCDLGQGICFFWACAP